MFETDPDANGCLERARGELGWPAVGYAQRESQADT
jgi:hypothetical protein